VEEGEDDGEDEDAVVRGWGKVRVSVRVDINA
jgi:hypothetical protein